MPEEVALSVWPRQDEVYSKTPEQQKDHCVTCINYAIASHTGSARRNRIMNMNKNFNGYNGVVDSKGIAYLNKTYGRQNVVKYIDYRYGKTKLDLLQGEQLKQSLNSTVYCVNSEAKSKLLEQYAKLLGMKYSAEQTSKLKDTAGVDVNGGMPSPTEDDDVLWDKLNAKQKNQFVMQTIINKTIQSEDLRTKFSSNYLDGLITAECYGKVYIDTAGYVRFREIDPRDGIFEEIDRDHYLQRSPYMGERRWMFAHDIVGEYPNLTEAEKKRVYDFATNGDVSNMAEGNRSYYRKESGSMYFLVHTLEWFVFEPRYTTIRENPADPENPFVSNLSNDYYNKNKKKVDKAVAKGDYRLQTKYKKVVWQCTKIGQDIYTDWGPKSNIIGSISNPYETLMSYTGMLLNTKDGLRVSLQETLENISDVINVTMFQIRRELAKAKGKVMAYDKAGLPKGMTMKMVLQEAINDGIIQFSSAAEGIAGNIGQEKLTSIAGFLKEIDLGISATMPVLLEIKNDMKNMAAQLTGINDERQGDIAASSTATNANSSIQASRSITAPTSFFFSRYCENVLLRIAEYGKIAYGILNPELGETLLGSAGVRFIKIDRSLSYDDYACFLSDARKEEEIRGLLRQWMPLAINAGEMRVQDALKVEMSQTLVEAEAKLEESWQKVEAVRAQESQAKNEAQQQAVTTQTQGQAAQQDKDFEYQKLLKIVEYLLKAGVITQEAKNEYLLKAQEVQAQEAANAAAAQPLQTA